MSPPATSELPMSLSDVQEAARRIAPHVRRTPSLRAEFAGVPSLAGLAVTLKLEHLQVGGSFKARGAANRIAAASPDEVARGVVTASGGNHGIGVAWAASRFGARATVYLPETAPVSSERLLQSMGADTIRRGAAWDDAWALAAAAARASGALLVHPFEDPRVIAGQGTVALELLADTPDLDVLIVAVGGGGLISGVALAAKALRPGIRVIGVEPTGATSMKDSLAAGHVVELPSVRTIAGTLAPRAVGPLTLAFTRAFVDEIVLVEDDQMREAMRALWREARQLVEPAGAAALAAAMALGDRLRDEFRGAGPPRVGVLVCGANLDVSSILGPL